MRRNLIRMLHQEALWVLAALVLALGTATLLAAPGVLFADEERAPALASGPVPAEPAEEPAERRPSGTSPEPAATLPTVPDETVPAEAEPPPPAETATPDTAPAAAPRAVFVVAASRGDCWLQARAGSATGRVLYEGILEQGASVRLEGARVWLRLGAAANVDVTVDGARKPLPSGTVDVLVDGRRARPTTGTA